MTVIEDAVHILKPFFLEMMAKKVADEQIRVLDDEFGCEQQLDRDVAFHHYFSKMFPEADRSAVSEHLNNYNKERLSFEVG